MASVTPPPLPRTYALQRPAVLWVVLSGILLFVLLAAYASSWQNDRSASSEFEHAIERYQLEVERQLRGLQAATLGLAAGVGVGSEPVSRTRFERLAAPLNAPDALGAVGAIALLDWVEDREIPAWRMRVQRQYPEFEIQPGWEGTQPGERLLVRNRWPLAMAHYAIGRNMGSQSQRVAAAVVADGSKLPVLSQVFVEPTAEGTQKAYVMMAPVGPVADTDPSRRHAPQLVPTLRHSSTRQWVSLLVFADELFRKPIPAINALLSVHVVDVDAADSMIQVVFDSHGDSGLRTARFSGSRTLSSMGRKWHVTYASTPAFEATHRDVATSAIGLTGLLVGLGVMLAFLHLRRAERSATVDQARSEARFEQLNAMLPIGVFEADASGRLTDANGAACALVAAPRDSLIGRGYLRCIEATERRWLLDAWRNFRAGAAPFCAEHRVRGADGVERWVLTEIVCHEGSEGSARVFVGTCIDITARRAFELDLLSAQHRASEAEARLTAAIDAMDAGFELFGPDNRLVMSNARVQRFIGPGGGELRKGMHREEVHRLLYGALAGGMDPDGEHEFRERRVPLDNTGAGTLEERIGGRWFRVTRRNTASGDMISLRLEITQQKLRELEIQKLAAVASQTADGVALLDRTGRIEWVNPAYERLTGYALEEIRGMRGREFLQGPMTDPLTSSTVAACTDACVPFQVEVVHYTKLRETVWFELRSQPLLDAAGQPVGMVQTRFDISKRKAAEAAANAALTEQQRAEARLRESISALDAAFSLFDPGERLVVCNDLYLRMFGTAAHHVAPGMLKAELLALLCQQLFPSSDSTDDAPGRERWIEDRLAEFRAADGCCEYPIGGRWYSTTHRRTPAGDTVALRIDITGAREREAQLEKLSLVASRTDNSVLITDECNRIEWVNESFERQTGYRSDEVLGRTPGQLLTGPLTDTALVDEMARMMQEGVGHRLELINYRRNGDPYWASIERQPIHGDEGRVVRWIRLSLDVSERKRAELALRSSEARNRLLATVVQQTTAAVITKDLDNRITTWNRGAELLYGYTAEEAVGRLSHELLNPDALPAHITGLLERIRNGSADVGRLRHVRVDGTRIDIESSHAPQIDDDGTLVGRITVIRDITEQLRAQRSIEAARVAAEQAQEAMSSFLSNMSHELRTPMHAILSYARLGQDRIVRGTPEKTSQYLDRIEQSGVRLLALLNDLLDLSRLEAGRSQIDPGRHELAMTVDAAILEVDGLAQSRQLSIERAGLRSLPAWYDPARIAQVLTNVVGNAVKFSAPGGTITITLGQCCAPDGRPLAEVVVADHGIGIPEGERESIFDKFVQSSKTRTGAGGTGLGLAISRELVLAHGGEIRAEDNPGGGTRFVFTLPQEPSTGRIDPAADAAPAGAADPDRRAA